MDLLIALLVFVVIAVVLLWLFDQMPMTDAYKKIIKVVVVAILLVVFLIRFVMPYLGAHGTVR